MNLWNKIIISICSRILFRLYRLKTKNINYHSLTKKRATNLDYKIDKFRDLLFNINSQYRENFAIIKILKNYLFFLCNETYLWVAVNIPLDLCGGKTKGDIDILIAMIIFPPKDDDEIQKIYRTFEVKASKVNIDKTAKSLKIGKFEKVKDQVNKLIEAGSQQAFLLEAYILEAGYSLQYNQLPSFVTSFIRSKVSDIKNENFGYTCIFLEQQRGFDEERVYINHSPMCLKSADIKEMHKPIRDIVLRIEDYFENNKEENIQEPTFITYCEKCKKLITLPIRGGPYKCIRCKKSILYVP
ncbi:MAG: hypothetical protein GF370_02065 [Candidatus Nealsonbacteria bacterium]|nr:hypothetical protein [Candidatus Nealsonbacteria bacterium]